MMRIVLKERGLSWLARVRYDRGGEGGREALVIGNCSIII